MKKYLILFIFVFSNYSFSDDFSIESLKRKSYAGQLCLSQNLYFEVIKIARALISARANIYQTLRRPTHRHYQDGIAMSLSGIRYEIGKLFRDLIKQACQRDATIGKCFLNDYQANKACLQQAKRKCINEKKGTWIEEKYDNGCFLKK